MDVGDDDWIVISGILAEIEQLLRRAGDPGADHLAGLLGDRQGGVVVDQLTGPGMWGHMGSFFDRSLDDRDLDREFRRAQVRLADALEAAGVATHDVRKSADVLRIWESQGI